MLTTHRVTRPLLSLRPRLGRAWYEWRGAGNRRAAVGVLSAAVRELPPQPGLPPASQWSVRQVLSTQTDVTVAIFGTGQDGALAVGRIADPGRADPGLLRNHDTETELRADPRLHELHRLLPAPLAAGYREGRAFALERAIRGRPIDPLLDGPEAEEALDAAAGVLRLLHEPTARVTVIDEALLEQWFGRRLDILRAALGQDADAGSRVDRLRGELFALHGQRCAVAWTHGDFWCGNLLLDPVGGQVAGLIDWDAAAPDGLPVTDLVHFLLTTRAAADSVDVGELVASMLAGRVWTPHEQRLLAAAGWCLPVGDDDQRLMILATWLAHVSEVLAKRPAYAANRRWMGRNVGTVLPHL